ncbi:MAG: ATP-binding protein [Gemmatimonadaceae bacterium]
MSGPRADRRSRPTANYSHIRSKYDDYLADHAAGLTNRGCGQLKLSPPAAANAPLLERREDVIFMGPVGVGKTSLACALGHSACRAGRRVLFLRADHLFEHIHQSRADNSTERVLRSLLTPDLLIIDDFGLRRLNAQQSSDFYEVVIERNKRASTVVTSNRAIEEWIPLFDDPILAQSALDRLAHSGHQIVMDGPSYRTRQRPGRPAEAPARPESRGKVAR